MSIDPIPLVGSYLASCPEIPEDAVTATLVGREVGATTVYLMQTGGVRLVRDRLDRADVLYDVYGTSPEEAGTLAHLVRGYLLEQLPGESLKGALVLDVHELSAPHWNPDQVSDEPAYTGEVSLLLVADD